MKTLPKLPYLQNIVAEYLNGGAWPVGPEYKYWLAQFGFKVPVQGDYLEFPDDFSEKALLMFILRFGG